jgi:hypothetical protein
MQRLNASSDARATTRCGSSACELLPAEQGQTATQAIFEQLLVSLKATPTPEREIISPALALQSILWSLTLERQVCLVDALEQTTDRSKIPDCLRIIAERLDASLVDRALALARAYGDHERAQLLFTLAAHSDERRLTLQRKALLMAAESRDVEAVFPSAPNALDIAPLADAIVAMARARPRFTDRSSWLPRSGTPRRSRRLSFLTSGKPC